MPTIDRLSTIDNVTGSDQVPLYDASNGQARKASMSQVLAYFQSTFASPEFDVIISSPIAGFNQQLAASTKSIWLILTPAGTLATGTVTLPPVADCFDGQEVLVTSTQQITALTVAGNGATVNGAPSSIGANGAFRLRYNTLLTTWYMINGASSLSSLNVSGTATIGTLVVTGQTTMNDLDMGGNNISDVNELAATGDITLNGEFVVTDSGSYTLTNKTLTTPKFTSTTVASLPAAASNATARAFVTDASSTLAANIGTTVLGGGSNVVPVYCDGVSWKYG